MAKPNKSELFICTMLMVIAAISSPARATTGSGCYQVVNVRYDDVLNVRARPSANSAIVYRIPADGGPIISGGSSNANALARCVPSHGPVASRWCPVSIYSGSGSYSGWVKRRYLSPSDCP